MASAPVVLVTGFEPFGGMRTNPSGDAVRRLAAEWTGDADLRTAILPVAFERGWAALEAALGEHTLAAVIAVGVAEGRVGVTPERVAVNLDDARIADNDGAAPQRQPIDPAGPAERATRLPVDAIVAALTAASIAAAPSDSAGRYVCNHVFYRLLGATGPEVAAGFVHVPATPEAGAGADVPTASLDEIVAALATTVTVVADSVSERVPS